MAALQHIAQRLAHLQLQLHWLQRHHESAQHFDSALRHPARDYHVRFAEAYGILCMLQHMLRWQALPAHGCGCGGAVSSSYMALDGMSAVRDDAALQRISQLGALFVAHTRLAVRAHALLRRGGAVLAHMAHLTHMARHVTNSRVVLHALCAALARRFPHGERPCAAAAAAA